MPKQKSHRAAKKRLRVTAKGRVKRNSAYTSHLQSSKTSKRRRNLRQGSILKKCDEKRIKPLIVV